MAGEPFYLPNFGTQPQGYNLGLGNFNQQFTMPNWNMNTTLNPGALSLTNPVNPAQARLDGYNQQMAPNGILPYVNLGIQGVNTLGNLFLGWQAMQQAQEAATWQRGMAENNYKNSVDSYNTAMEDKVRGRYAPTSDSNVQAAIDAEVKRRQIGGK
jgi:hypothetical protein